jgi:hypothetical protein
MRLDNGKAATPVSKVVKEVKKLEPKVEPKVQAKPVKEEPPKK